MGKADQDPPGTTFNDWYIAEESGRHVIRRMVVFPDGRRSQRRLSPKKYAQYKDLRELEDFVIRLNGKDPRIERIKESLNFQHAFISEDLLIEYRDVVLPQHISSRKNSNTAFSYLHDYCLRFFIAKLGLANPIDWHKQQFLWGKYLLNTDEDIAADDPNRLIPAGEVLSVKVLKQIVFELNRFMKFLNLKRPGEAPSLYFEPFSKAKLKQHESRRHLLGLIRPSMFIKDEDWQKIDAYLKEKKPAWEASCRLAALLGLRRNEAMGLLQLDVRKDHVHIVRQFKRHHEGQVEHDILKGRRNRKVPYWLITPKETYNLVKQLVETKLPHPDTVSREFTAMVAELGLRPYIFHDLRRTFITNSVKKKIEPEALRLAAGHSTIDTTYKYYVMDARELEDDLYVPEDESN